MNPLQILPQEMWREVLDNLRSVKDQLSAYNTCQLWMSILGEKKTEWMFQDVLPFLSKYLSKEDILGCRGVCKNWKKAVDSHLESGQPSLLAPGKAHLLNSGTPLRSLHVDFAESGRRLKVSEVKAIEQFQTEFKSCEGPSGKNPFVSRSLVLDITKMNAITALKFFENFGVHLWSLQLSIMSEKISPVDTCKFLWKILSCVPNLKKLSLVVMQDGNVHSTYIQKIEDLEVKEFLKTNLLPPLPQLNNLEFNVNNDLLRQVLETGYAPQLSRYVHDISANFIPNNLDNLTEMVWCYKNYCEMAHLSKLSDLKIPSLRRLHIYFQNMELNNKSNYSIDQLLKPVESFKRSLTHLSIVYRYCEPAFPTQLDLPCVQEVCVELTKWKNENSVNFSFLTGLKSLRKLTVVFFKEGILKSLKPHQKNVQKVNQSVEESVDLHCYLNSDDGGVGPYKSNIWRLVPSLEIIEFQIVDRVSNWPDNVTSIKTYIRSDMKKNTTF